MKVGPTDFIAVHHEPAWREIANYVFHAYLGVENGRDEWEQLWGRKTERDSVILCCIPFFAYDLSLGDELILDDGIVRNVLVRSDQRTFRVYLSERGIADYDQILRNLVQLGSIVEQSSNRFLAISIAFVEAQSLANHLQKCEDEGLLEYETGQTQAV